MSLTKKVMGTALRVTGSVIANAGTRRFEKGTLNGMAIFLSGKALENLPGLIDPDNMAPSRLSAAVAAGTTINAAKMAEKEYLVDKEPANYVMLRRLGALSLRMIDPAPNKFNALGDLADAASVAIDSATTKLESENNLGYAIFPAGLARALHIASTFQVARNAAELTPEEYALI